MNSSFLSKLVVSLMFIATLMLATTQATGTPMPAQSAAAPAASNTANQSFQEVAVLRAQLSEAQRFQEQILSTVYWSLSGLAGVAVLLVGFGWWTNLRVYERDKQSLERELRLELAEISRQSNDQQQKHLENGISDLKQQITADASANEERLAVSLKASIEEQERKSSSQISQIRSIISSLQKEIRELQLTEQLRERLVDRNKKVYRNALQASVTALELANKLGRDYTVGEVLDFVAEDIDTLLKGSDLPVDNYLLGQLVAGLDAVKGSHAHAAAALKAKAARLVSSS